MTGSITIVIPTYNRAPALEAVWPSYLAQSSAAAIIVVNDGSDVATSARIQSLVDSAPGRARAIVHPTRRGQQRARTSALRYVRTGWVLFGEDDVYLHHEYCEVLLREAAALKADAIAGRLVNARVPGGFSASQLTDCHSHSDGPIFDMSVLNAQFDAWLPTAVEAPFLHSIALVRRTLLEEVPFDPWYRGNAHREETDFYLGAAERGFRLVLSPETVCFHLRGPISASGGHRISRISVEFWNALNTWHMVRKHWDYLRSHVGVADRSPATWMLRYLWRRQFTQLGRALRSGFQSSFRP